MMPLQFMPHQQKVLKETEQFNHVAYYLDMGLGKTFVGAEKMLGMNHNTVRKGLQQGVFPWGYAIHTSEHRWVYFINALRFAEIEGVQV